MTKTMKPAENAAKPAGTYYRLGKKQQATLERLAEALNEHADSRLRQMLSAAIGANVPLQAIADRIGLSYTGLINWIGDGEMTTGREAVLPRVVLLHNAMAIGLQMNVLPVTDGFRVGPVLHLLVRCLELKAERDVALANVATLKGLVVQAMGEGPADPDTVQTYDLPAEE